MADASAEQVCEIKCEKDSYMVVVDVSGGNAKAKAFYKPGQSERIPYPVEAVVAAEPGSVVDSVDASGIYNQDETTQLISPLSTSRTNNGGKMRRRTRSRVTRNRKYHRRNRRTARRG